MLGQTTDGVFKFAVDGSAPIPLTYLDPDDVPLQWSTDESLLFVGGRSVAAGGGPGEHGYGRPRAWKTIQPADPAGVDSIVRILITPDGKSYCHDYVRVLSELSIVEGLK